MKFENVGHVVFPASLSREWNHCFESVTISGGANLKVVFESAIRGQIVHLFKSTVDIQRTK